jgi:hypothetical protein
MKKPRHVELLQLLRDIRRVNPTGRKLSKADVAARYEEKARLQSALLEKYGAEIRIHLHADMPGVVSLSAPRFGESGGHAVVEALSARARAFIEMACEQPVEVGSPGPLARPGGRDGATDPVDRARAFLREYDYDCAETTLRDALSDSHPEAVREAAYDMLLELLVSVLGRDEDAMELAARPGVPVESPKARACLALAAARAGHLDEALRRSQGELSEEVHALLLDLATRAAARGEWPQVRRALERTSAAAHATGSSLSSEAVKCALDTIRSHFEHVTVDQLRDNVDLRRVVEALSPRLPSLLRHAEGVRKDRREQSVAHALRRVEDAAASGNIVDAEAALRVASHLEDVMTVEQRELFASHASRLREDRVRSVVARFTTDVAALGEDAVGDFLRLSPALRAAVLDATIGLAHHALLRLADRLDGAAGSQHAAARAVVAWACATTRTQGEVESEKDLHQLADAWEELLPHSRLLRTVPEIATELQAFERAHGEQGRPRDSRIALECCDPSICVEHIDCSVAPSTANLLVATRIVVARGQEWIVAAVVWSNHGELWMRPLSSASPALGLHLELPNGVWLSHLLVEGETIHLVDSSRAHRRVELGTKIRVVRTEDVRPLLHDGTLAACEDQVILLIDAAVSARRDAVVAGTRRPATSRIEGATLVRTDVRTGDTENLALPLGVRPHLVVESPLGDRAPPIVVEAVGDDEPMFVWWRPMRGLWRGFRLAPHSGSESLLEAHTLSDAVLLGARRPEGLVLHHLAVDGGRIIYGGSTRHDDGVGVALDPESRRAWVVRRTAGEPSGFGATRVVLRTTRRLRSRAGTTSASGR